MYHNEQKNLPKQDNAISSTTATNTTSKTQMPEAGVPSDEAESELIEQGIFRLRKPNLFVHGELIPGTEISQDHKELQSMLNSKETNIQEVIYNGTVAYRAKHSTGQIIGIFIKAF